MAEDTPPPEAPAPDGRPDAAPPAASVDAFGDPTVTEGIPLETVAAAGGKAAAVTAAVDQKAVKLADKVETAATEVAAVTEQKATDLAASTEQKATDLAEDRQQKALDIALASQKRDLEVDHVLADHTTRLTKIDATLTEVNTGFGSQSVALGRIEAHIAASADSAKTADEQKRAARTTRISIAAVCATGAAIAVSLLSITHVIG